MYVRKADRPAFEDAVSTALVAVSSQLNEFRDTLVRALDDVLASSCPDHLLEPVRREVLNRILRHLLEPIEPPLVLPDDLSN
jgi:hypothetical protein